MLTGRTGMISPFNRLGPKLILMTLVFMLILALITSVLITQGFQRAQTEGLMAQGQESLLALTQLQGQLSTAEFQQARHTGTIAGRYIVAAQDLDSPTPWDSASRMRRRSDGQFADENPARLSDVVIPNTVREIDPQMDANLRYSAILDSLAPLLLTDYPDAAALYYISPDGATRFYPVIGLADVTAPDLAVTKQPFYTVAANQPGTQRDTAWTPPYIDPAGQGLLVTASTPIYDGETFRGVIGIDVSLKRLVDRLNRLKPTPQSSAFLLDQNGHLIAASSAALPTITEHLPQQTPSLTATLGLTLSQTQNQDFRQALEAMQGGQTGIKQLTLAGTPMFLAYAPVSNVGWSLAIMAPQDEVANQSAAANTAIQTAITTTLATTLATLGVVFLLALGAMVFISRRITQPLTHLAEAAHTVADGNLSVALPVSSKDELGVLASSFNQMVQKLGQQRAAIEARNQDLQRSIETQHQLLETVQELSTPLMPILDGVVVLPIVGHLDGQRAEDLTTTLLQGVVRHRARVVILDVTGIAAMDTHVVRLLLQAAQATELLGAQVFLVGIRAPIAQILVDQHIDLRSVKTYRDLRSALGALMSEHTFTT